MLATKKIPATVAERLQLPDTPQFFPATEEEYGQLLGTIPYPLEYIDDKIVALSFATELHEEIVIAIAHFLYGLKKIDPAFRIMGSNHLVHTAGRQGNFQPDILVVRGSSQVYKLGEVKSAVRNPFLVVEVHSAGTRPYDLSVKLPVYKANPSLEYILYVEQDQPLATLHTRIPGTTRWRSEDFTAEEGRFEVAGLPLNVNEFYPPTPLITKK